MNYDKLDNEELLRLALDAINGGRDADSVVMLKTLLERDATHVFGQYLLAAQHAQLNMFDRAEAGFRAVVAKAPDFSIARFQLSQLLLMKGAAAEAKQLLGPVSAQTDALGAYARGLSAAADENLRTALHELEAGLAMAQEIPALATDMQRLHGQFQRMAAGSAEMATATPVAPSAAAPMFLANYEREG
jgi:hypothetical protein